MHFKKFIVTWGIGLGLGGLLPGGAEPAWAGRAQVAPADETWYLAFPQYDQTPDFTLCSAQLLQTSRPMQPALQDLPDRPGPQPATGVATLVLAGAEDSLVNFLDLHPGLDAVFYDLRTGDSITLADCRLLHPLPDDRDGLALHTLQMAYRGITFWKEPW